MSSGVEGCGMNFDEKMTMRRRRDGYFLNNEFALFYEEE
jgi:hypothetical protein